MGAVRRMFAQLVDANDPISIEFVTQGQGINTISESLSSYIGVSNSLIKSSTSQDVLVDWGDGSAILTFSLVANVAGAISGNTPSRYLYSSPFNYPVVKQIRMTFQDATKILTLDLRNWWLRGNLSTAIDILTGLTELRLNNNLLDTIPSNIQYLPLQILSLLGSPSLAGIIPSYIFNITTLKTFDFTLNPIGANSYATCRYDQLQYLPVLDRLDIGQNGFTELPSFIFDCVNLVTLSVTTQRATPNGIDPTIPSNANLATKLKTFNSSANYRNRSDIDSFINNFYTLITTEAAISGASTLKFRGMTLTITLNQLPTGVYRQPSGYVAGVSNGSPASPQEKVWLLVNQYLHTVSLPTHSVSAITVGATTNVTLTASTPNLFQVADNTLQVGSVIHFLGITGTVGAALNGIDHTITAIAGNVLTISTNTVGLAYTSGGSVYRVSI